MGDLWGLKYIFQQEGEACPHHFSASASKWKNSSTVLEKETRKFTRTTKLIRHTTFLFFFQRENGNSPPLVRVITRIGKSSPPPPFSLYRIAIFGSRASTQLYASLLPIHPEELISRFLMRGGEEK